MKHLLLAGSTGYLGKHILIFFLKEGYQISIIVNSESKLYKIENLLSQVKIINIEDVDFHKKINECKFDMFISAAVDYGYITTNSSVIDCNIKLPMKIIESIENKKELMVITFDSFYSKNKYYEEVAQSRYTLSKKQLIEWLNYENKISSLTSLILRLEHVIGPKESTNKFNGWLIDKLKLDSSVIELTMGEQIRDFILISDILTAIKLLIENSAMFISKNTLIDVGSGKGYTIKEFVELLHKKTNSNATLKFGAMQYKRDDLMQSIAKNDLLLGLGWKPISNLEQIIDNVI